MSYKTNCRYVVNSYIALSHFKYQAEIPCLLCICLVSVDSPLHSFVQEVPCVNGPCVNGIFFR